MEQHLISTLKIIELEKQLKSAKEFTHHITTHPFIKGVLKKVISDLIYTTDNYHYNVLYANKLIEKLKQFLKIFSSTLEEDISDSGRKKMIEEGCSDIKKEIDILIRRISALDFKFWGK